MKLFQTPAAVESETYPNYVHDCQRGPCELPFAAPVPSIPEVQFYIDFGILEPVAIEVKVQSACTDGASEQIFTSNYVVGQTPEGNYYGVFKYFNTPAGDFSKFVIWVRATFGDLSEKTYFSEMMIVERCHPLMKLKACQPEQSTTTGFDINGIYYGLPVNPDFMGLDGVRYFHIAFARFAKIRETSYKGTFTQSYTRNFRTEIEKISTFETEISPKWYKDILLAIFARGAFMAEGKTWLVSDLAFESINDDDLMWKPFAQVKETFRLFFGCDDSECVECCAPQVLSAGAETLLESESDIGPCECASIDPETGSAPDGLVGVPYNFVILLLGTAPFVLSDVTKPSWMTANVVGNAIVFGGTPDATGENLEVSFDLANCGDACFMNNTNFFIDVTAP